MEVDGAPEDLAEAFVGWPSGPGGLPVVYSEAEVRIHAPLGIYDPTEEARVLAMVPERR